VGAVAQRDQGASAPSCDRHQPSHPRRARVDTSTWVERPARHSWQHVAVRAADRPRSTDKGVCPRCVGSSGHGTSRLPVQPGARPSALRARRGRRVGVDVRRWDSRCTPFLMRMQPPHEREGRAEALSVSSARAAWRSASGRAKPRAPSERAGLSVPALPERRSKGSGSGP
jgi:hypothetical protein